MKFYVSRRCHSTKQYYRYFSCQSTLNSRRHFTSVHDIAVNNEQNDQSVYLTESITLASADVIQFLSRTPCQGPPIRLQRLNAASQQVIQELDNVQAADSWILQIMKWWSCVMHDSPVDHAKKDYVFHTNVVNNWKTFLSLRNGMRAANEIMTLSTTTEPDEEMYRLAADDYTTMRDALQEQVPILLASCLRQMLSRIPLLQSYFTTHQTLQNDVVLELHAATGGDEAALFAHDLYQMYKSYAEQHQWKWQVISMTLENNQLKEASVAITGRNVYEWLQYEAGVHRVQRVPITDAQGRIHTSTATVALLAQPRAIDFPVVTKKDVKIETFRASGAGGQHVNTTDSAVRVTHLASGLVVAAQSERSQHANLERALNVLTAKLYERERVAHDEARSSHRKSQVGLGTRSEKIRTFNFPQQRVTEHRLTGECHVTVTVEGEKMPRQVTLHPEPSARPLSIHFMSMLQGDRQTLDALVIQLREREQAAQCLEVLIHAAAYLESFDIK